ncbi:hypothetical protein BBK36DRAFT_1164856 [Trichoderma citrinoviride]|uniref:Zn(2)-C6 fungal-type domain-containing protein n=1 Tax=Trichoderma citrinoviride TaxID=58853 RepID=A0A2T4BLX0_9HYPO|nr:hypothetical protein BBK36DRAFT_1164856 [Trichoderma citrinoviride]PTB70307.1 hypothetical protein BBK36DRAFT_1164856 [Trichoderma citrinoviride]
MPPERLFENKAPKACRHCRLHKRRCDKKLPSCSTCSSKWNRCEYDDNSPIETVEPETELKWSEPLAVSRFLCGLELTSAGEKQLLWTACQTEGIPWGPEFNSRTLMGLVKDIFSYGGTTTEQVAAEYFAKVHEWIPIVNEAWITAELKSISLQGYARPRDDALALLLLCMGMVNHHCRHPNHSPHSTLYRTTRRLFTLVDTANASHLLAKLQAGLLLTTYECGHGMAVEASSTLATAIVLSCPNGEVALLIPTRGLLPEDVIPFVTQVEYAVMNTETKFQARVYAALCIGEAITAGHDDPDASACAAVEKLLHHLVRQHAETTDNKDIYPVCEGMAMALSAVVSLYKERIRKFRSTADAKLDIDIKFAYNIAFEMCRVEGALIKKRKGSHAHRLCFSGLGCLYRAAVDLDEICPNGSAPEDFKQLRENLKWFSRHWSVGERLLWRSTCNWRERVLPPPF